jgi:hypothetical protein
LVFAFFSPIPPSVPSEVPAELDEICRKEWGNNVKNVGINLVDKTKEEYVAPKPKFDFATSKGQSLSSAPKTNTAVSFADATPQRVTPDAAQPTTVLQIVLADRKKSRETFNHATTVLQLYQHVMS